MPNENARFSQGLCNPHATLPQNLTRPSALGGESTPHKRFAIYQNNVLHSLITALKTRFPVVMQLCGEAFFNTMARDFIRASPPTSPLLWQYGEAFACFIERFTPAKSLPYLADMARLETAIAPVFHAKDEAALTPQAFQALLTQDLAQMTFEFTPSFALIESEYALFSLWEMHQEGQSPHAIDIQQQDFILLWREDYLVRLRPLLKSDYQLLTALKAKTPFGEALATTHYPLENLSSFFALLFETRLITGATL